MYADLIEEINLSFSRDYITEAYSALDPETEIEEQDFGPQPLKSYWEDCFDKEVKEQLEEYNSNFEDIPF